MILKNSHIDHGISCPCSLTVLKAEENSAQKVRCHADQLMEIHSSRTEDGIDPVTQGSFKAVTIHSVLAFQMADTWLFCFDCFGLMAKKCRKMVGYGVKSCKSNSTK